MTIAADNIVPFLRKEERTLTILVVEDDRIERIFMEEQIKDLGHAMLSAENGQQALDMLAQMGNGIDVILMDKMMPVLDGLSAVKRIKQNAQLKNIPIVMITGAASAKDIQEGIDAGVFYYLAKPVNEDVLKSVLTAATREATQRRDLSDELFRHKSSFNMIETCKFRFSTIEEAETLSTFMAYCFPDPARVFTGLLELMGNAIEHGIYNIGYERKSELIESGTFRAELQRRQSLPEYHGRYAEAVVTHKDNGIYAVISDQGKGFNWKRYMHIEPSRAKDNHGRGIAQANAISFDKLTYNETGNQVVAYVSKTAQLNW